MNWSRSGLGCPPQLIQHCLPAFYHILVNDMVNDVSKNWDCSPSRERLSSATLLTERPDLSKSILNQTSWLQRIDKWTLMGVESPGQLLLPDSVLSSKARDTACKLCVNRRVCPEHQREIKKSQRSIQLPMSTHGWFAGSWLRQQLWFIPKLCTGALILSDVTQTWPMCAELGMSAVQRRIVLVCLFWGI